MEEKITPTMIQYWELLYWVRRALGTYCMDCEIHTDSQRNIKQDSSSCTEDKCLPYSIDTQNIQFNNEYWNFNYKERTTVLMPQVDGMLLQTIQA